MKLVVTIVFLFSWSLTIAQQQPDLIGTWKLTKVLDSSTKKCKKIKKYTLTIYSDNKYEMDFGSTSSFNGQWFIEDNKIKFDAQTIVDPCMEWQSDQQFKSFEITMDEILIMDIFICGTSEGRSYFKKRKRKKTKDN